MPFNFEILQDEAYEWSRKNFQNNTPAQPFHGIVEELGEFCAARHARILAARNLDAEGTKIALRDLRDSIADMAIFGVSYCGYRGFWLTRLLAEIGFPGSDIEDFQSAVACDRESENPLLVLVIHVGNLAHHRLKAHQGIRGDAETHEAGEKIAVAELFVSLAQICTHFGFSFETLLAETWAKVKQRDWTAKGVEPGVLEWVETPEPLASQLRAMCGPCPTATAPDEPDVYADLATLGAEVFRSR